MGLTLKLPDKLEALIESGLWPNKNNADAQNLKPLVSCELIQQLFPEENSLYLFPPPFISIHELLMQEDSLYQSKELKASFSQIKPRKTVVIADFGLGSESALVLDYSDSESNPKILKLSWLYDEKYLIRKVEWVVVAADFDEFAAHLNW